ncbi:MAG: hypothetical protein AABX24_02070 [Nanoarchaeota archaeon]
MEQYKVILGMAAGASLCFGLYAYQSHNPTDNTSTTEFLEEEKVSEPERPYHQKKRQDASPEKKKERKPVAKLPKTTNYKSSPKIQLYHPSRPRYSTLDYVLEEEEDDGEKPWYDLSQEERKYLIESWGGEDGKSKRQKVDEYFHTALEEDNFKVAASYITDSKRIAELEQQLTPEAYEKIETDLVYGIASEYDIYLSEVIEKCYQHDYDSVFRKVMWMNFFLAEHPNAFIPSRYVKNFSLDEMFRKGNEALDSIEYCIEKKIP